MIGGWLGRAFVVNYQLPVRSPDHECCVWAGHVLRTMWGDPVIGHSGVPWPADGWRGEPFASWHVWDRARPWSSIEAAVSAGLAEDLRHDGPIVQGEVEGWRLVQGWRRPPHLAESTGHEFFVKRAHPQFPSPLLVVDSTAGAGVRVRFDTDAGLRTVFAGGLAFARLEVPNVDWRVVR
jgi:hypothetical protein